MQVNITLDKDEIKEAIRQYIGGRNIMAVDEDASIELSGGRGGYSAVISIDSERVTNGPTGKATATPEPDKQPVEVKEKGEAPEPDPAPEKPDFIEDTIPAGSPIAETNPVDESNPFADMNDASDTAEPVDDSPAESAEDSAPADTSAEDSDDGDMDSLFG